MMSTVQPPTTWTRGSVDDHSTAEVDNPVQWPRSNSNRWPIRTNLLELPTRRFFLWIRWSSRCRTVSPKSAGILAVDDFFSSFSMSSVKRAVGLLALSYDEYRKRRILLFKISALKLGLFSFIHWRRQAFKTKGTTPSKTSCIASSRSFLVMWKKLSKFNLQSHLTPVGFLAASDAKLAYTALSWSDRFLRTKLSARAKDYISCPDHTKG